MRWYQVAMFLCPSHERGEGMEVQPAISLILVLDEGEWLGYF
jgi:hypothetical protein